MCEIALILYTAAVATFKLEVLVLNPSVCVFLRLQDIQKILVTSLGWQKILLGPFQNIKKISDLKFSLTKNLKFLKNLKFSIIRIFNPHNSEFWIVKSELFFASRKLKCIRCIQCINVGFFLSYYWRTSTDLYILIYD